MRSRIIASLATLLILLGLSTAALADDHFSATIAFPDDPGIPDGSD